MHKTMGAFWSEERSPGIIGLIVSPRVRMSPVMLIAHKEQIRTPYRFINTHVIALEAGQSSQRTPV